jgi:cyclophilin family peptidyl-prolyl cis-trans isomerase
MKHALWMAIALLGALLLVAGCPRTEGYTGQQAQPAAGDDGGADMQDTPAGDAAGMEDETAKGGAHADGGEAAGEDAMADEDAVADDEMKAEDSGEEADAETADGEGGEATAEEDEAMAETGNVTEVVLETTNGNIVLAVHEEWAPLGAEHFLELVKAGFYDGAPWFRVIDGFVAQCGVAADPAMNDEWENKTIMDEPVVQGNQRGYVAFGKTQLPNSRSTHIFINYGDNSGGLDRQGFSCFAQVIEGMDVADSLTRVEFGNQAALAAPGGMEMFKSQHPGADYIERAYIR